MGSNVENLGALERRFDITISLEKLQSEIDNRLQRLARTAKLHGFRPGKVPLKIITQMYGVQVQQDVLNDAVHKEFKDTVQQQNLQVAGYPRFEAKATDGNDALYTVSATFEVYPEIVLGDLSNQSIEQPTVKVGETDIDKTLDMICKQRVTYQPVNRPAKKGDRVKIDYHGTIDGNDFAGGKSNDVYLILGDGKFLKDFEAALIDMQVGSSKSFDVVFPEDYHGKEIAGKTVTFEVTLNELAEPVLPAVDTEFAKSLGIPDGDLQKLREGIQKDLEREVSKRARSKLKEQIMQALLSTTQIDAPSILINQEKERLLQNAKSDLEARGMKAKEISLSSDLFKEKAEYRVKLGLILAELVKVHALKATPEQVRRIIEDAAQSYENPEQVVKWHYASSERLQEAESLALEENVVDWALGKIKLINKTVTFDELMGIS
ncbi:trigger factor [Nitrosomonas oligotropha]|uniref:Trigger factor n=1 Tax=Nitrosomonas oligotropha TaxID=42354 RepID=A0A1H8RNL2_9PROT|nr:trigger factor [Nitrosomonas oligotropha]SDX03493.1 trigger factor [Nitrosomonas oligotropha]SEO67946.1 trigger factor [Nitrosomonas oligotropha]